MRRALPALAALAAAAAAAIVPAAHAGPPGTWTRVTDTSGVNTDQVALARTSDGVLHLAWLRAKASPDVLLHTAISPAGRVVGAASTIVSGWSALTNAGLVVGPDGGLRALFSGIRSTDVTDPFSVGDVYTATADASGASWTLGSGAVSAHSAAYASDQISAATLAGGDPISVWSNTFGLFAHVGLDTATPNLSVPTSCCAYSAALARDAGSGRIVMAYYSNATGAYGIHVDTLLPGGPQRILPGSANAAGNAAVSPTQRVSITGRLGATGVYVAYGGGYPTWTRLLLWNDTAGSAATVASGSIRYPTVTVGPEGRLWLLWQDGSRLRALRTNKAATRFGPIASFSPPAGTDTVWKLTGDGALGPLDVLASVSTPGSLAAWHTQLLPPLSASAAGAATFRVTDVGDPVAGATIRVAGHTLTTNAAGRATVALPHGTYVARVTTSGYRPATVRVRRP